MIIYDDISIVVESGLAGVLSRIDCVFCQSFTSASRALLHYRWSLRYVLLVLTFMCEPLPFAIPVRSRQHHCFKLTKRSVGCNVIRMSVDLSGCDRGELMEITLDEHGAMVRVDVTGMAASLCGPASPATRAEHGRAADAAERGR